MTCKDTSGSCTQYAQYCNTGTTLGGVAINTVCPRTCQVCDCKLFGHNNKISWVFD